MTNLMSHRSVHVTSVAASISLVTAGFLALPIVGVMMVGILCFLTVTAALGIVRLTGRSLADVIGQADAEPVLVVAPVEAVSRPRRRALSARGF